MHSNFTDYYYRLDPEHFHFASSGITRMVFKNLEHSLIRTLKETTLLTLISWDTFLQGVYTRI